MIAIALLAVLQQTPPMPPPPPLPRSPIARVVVQPVEAAVVANDTIRLTATAYDSSGAEIKNVRVSWATSGGFFEGKVDSTGLVTGGATGTINVGVSVRPLGGGRPMVAVARVTVLPPPAARIEIEPRFERVYAGQTIPLTATVLAANGDRRYDPVAWRSDRPAVLSVNGNGSMTARAAGRATLTARAGQATASRTIVVSVNPIRSLAIAPASSTVRTGDVVRLSLVAKDIALSEEVESLKRQLQE